MAELKSLAQEETMGMVDKPKKRINYPSLRGIDKNIISGVTGADVGKTITLTAEAKIIGVREKDDYEGGKGVVVDIEIRKMSAAAEPKKKKDDIMKYHPANKGMV